MNPSQLQTAFAIIASLVIGCPSVLCAATPAQRESRQQERISQGIKSGELTPAEAARLEAREAQLRQQLAQDRAASGGKLTAEQRARLQKELDELSAKIAKNKHDGQSVKPNAKSNVGRRERRQQERIAAGIESGQLTPGEAAKLEAREATLRKQIAEDRAANGGKLTTEQRQQIQTELDQISAKIAKQKHDDQSRTPAK